MKQLMKAGIVGALFALLLPAPGSAQDATPALASLVRITCTRGGEPQPPGSGFVVTVEGDLATIVTASHVIEGAQCQVEFNSSADRLPVDRVLGIEAGDRHGLAALRVSGIPATVEALELDTETQVALGEPLLLAGFPQMARQPRVKQGVFSGPGGKLLLIDRPAGEGASVVRPLFARAANRSVRPRRRLVPCVAWGRLSQLAQDPAIRVSGLGPARVPEQGLRLPLCAQSPPPALTRVLLSAVVKCRRRSLIRRFV